MKSERNIRDSLATSEMVLKMLEDSTSSVDLGSEFLDSVEGCTMNGQEQLRLSYSVFLTDILFQSQQNQTDIGSLIVAVRLSCALENTSLLSPIRLSFRTVKQVNS